MSISSMTSFFFSFIFIGEHLAKLDTSVLQPLTYVVYRIDYRIDLFYLFVVLNFRAYFQFSLGCRKIQNSPSLCVRQSVEQKRRRVSRQSSVLLYRKGYFLYFSTTVRTGTRTIPPKTKLLTTILRQE